MTSQANVRFSDGFCMLILGSFHSGRSLIIRISQQQNWVNIDGRQSMARFISLGDVYFHGQRCFKVTRMIRTWNRINPPLEKTEDSRKVEDND